MDGIEDCVWMKDGCDSYNKDEESSLCVNSEIFLGEKRTKFPNYEFGSNLQFFLLA